MIERVVGKRIRVQCSVDKLEQYFFGNTFGYSVPLQDEGLENGGMVPDHPLFVQ